MATKRLPAHRFSVAPMMDCTDRHSRYLMRLISKRALLYTEMVTAAAVIHGDKARLLDYNVAEHPVALQLGGSDPKQMALAAKVGEDWGYDEININVGCPSDRVQSGSFGACLMAEPALVADLVAKMQAEVSVPVTVKNRIGIDDQDEYADLQRFVAKVSEAGCETFIIHARKAWLQGLSPKQNRDVPPLNYQRVRLLKSDFPALNIIVNGGIQSLQQGAEFLSATDDGPCLDGAMLGRAAYAHPYMLSGVDQLFFGESAAPLSEYDVFQAYLPYVQDQLAQGVRLGHLVRQLINLFQGRPGARLWRRHISENAHKPEAGVEVLNAAVQRVGDLHSC